MTSKPEPVQHGRYVIRLWRNGDGFAGRPFLGNMPVLPQTSGPTVQAVVVGLKHELDLRSSIQRKGRVDGVPSADEYAEILAFVAPDMHDNQTRMLRALFEAPERTLTATELAQAAGYKSHSSANVHFGNLGRRVAEELHFRPPERRDGTPVWTATLATGPDYELEPGEHFRWTMRPEVAKALEGPAKIVLLPPLTRRV